ncbi:hypothetical protein [Haladaptatus salinisoli]|uniref:hypothetical protein n=1 Tax=Haladaptatus salinisoli TaxID=2884876 RepID=UPI001D0AFDD6|nr:hypothetical protein [Haladaptatus salinisoli]
MRRREFVGKIGVGMLTFGVAGCGALVGRENESPIPLFVTNYDGARRTVTAIWRDDEGERGRETVTVPPENRVRIAEIEPSNGVIVETPSGFRKGGGPFWGAASAEIYVSGERAVEILPLKTD